MKKVFLIILLFSSVTAHSFDLKLNAFVGYKLSLEIEPRPYDCNGDYSCDAPVVAGLQKIKETLDYIRDKKCAFIDEPTSGFNNPIEVYYGLSERKIRFRAKINFEKLKKAKSECTPVSLTLQNGVKIAPLKGIKFNLKD